ncbi:hypothetical protein ANN_03519 [Periplaneta americana]|uniref:Uncharacterized protein n=1 Tax=Periplaneta americana TaxID=6978 RepID=A0ABQ8TZ63_PERAM|nr:hypothetical protein ANN_03519 [Periplaneta americana]
MAGLCEGDNEPPGSLKARNETFFIYEIDRKVQTAVKRWFRSQEADFYDTRIQKLIPWSELLIKKIRREGVCAGDQKLESPEKNRPKELLIIVGDMNRCILRRKNDDSAEGAQIRWSDNTIVEQLFIVRIHWAKYLAAKDIHIEKVPVHGENYVSRKALYSWVQKFYESRRSIEEETPANRDCHGSKCTLKVSDLRFYDRKAKWEVYEEVHCVSTDDSHRRADIVAIDRNRERGLILDPTVRMEQHVQQVPQEISDDANDPTLTTNAKTSANVAKTYRNYCKESSVLEISDDANDPTLTTNAKTSANVAKR